MDRRIDRGRTRVTSTHLDARAEVAELVRPRGCPQDVLELDVSVCDALVVQVLYGAGEQRAGGGGGRETQGLRRSR